MENVVKSNIFKFRPVYPWCFGWWPTLYLFLFLHRNLPSSSTPRRRSSSSVALLLLIADLIELLGFFFFPGTLFAGGPLGILNWTLIPEGHLLLFLSTCQYSVCFLSTFPSVTVHCFQTSWHFHCCVPLSYTLEFVASIFSLNSRASVCAVTQKNMSLKVCWGLMKGIWTLRLVLFVETFSRHVFFGSFWTALAPSTPPHQCLHCSVSSFWDMMRRISEPLTPFFLHFWKKPSNSCLTHASAVCISHQCLHFSISTGVMRITWVAWQSPVCACSLKKVNPNNPVQKTYSHRNVNHRCQFSVLPEGVSG